MKKAARRGARQRSGPRARSRARRRKGNKLKKQSALKRARQPQQVAASAASTKTIWLKYAQGRAQLYALPPLDCHALRKSDCSCWRPRQRRAQSIAWGEVAASDLQLIQPFTAADLPKLLRSQEQQASPILGSGLSESSLECMSLPAQIPATLLRVALKPLKSPKPWLIEQWEQ